MSEYDEEPMLTEREVAQRTNTSPRTWQNRRGAGNGPRYMLEAQRAFFDGHPERVSDEIVNEFSRHQPANYFPLKLWAEKTRAGIAAALSKVE